MGDRNELLRALPSVDSVVNRPEMAPLLRDHPRPLVVEGARRAVARRRADLQAGRSASADICVADVAAALGEWLEAGLRPVINATGVLLHTNLGRAPLAAPAVEHLVELAPRYCNLELELASGHRGSRQDVVRGLLLEVTGAEAGLVVNNNAAAVYLALRALGAGREVIVSRGELVEIGGSFRVPDVMAASGARLVEVGTTNKTRLSDYRRAIGPDTAMLLKVHRSNFELVGFQEEVAVGELAALAREARLPLVVDQGTGLPVRIAGLPAQIPVGTEPLAAGADLVCFSGDKLLGGPQCGLLLGRGELIERLGRDPMARALRVDKLTLAVLEASLALFRGGGERALREIPILRLLGLSPEVMRQRAEDLRGRLAGLCPVPVEVVATVAQVGGGSLPRLELPSFAVSLQPPDGDLEGLQQRLRLARPSLLARVHAGRLLLDVRTLLDDAELVTAADCLRSAWAGGGASPP